MNTLDDRSAQAGALAVRPYQDSDRQAWDAFVFACPQATFFHRIGWREIFETVFKHRSHYLIARRGEQIVGVLPLVRVKSLLFGNALTSLPFAVYGGVAVTDAAATGALHQSAITLGRELGVQHLELRNRETLEPGWPHQENQVLTELFGRDDLARRLRRSIGFNAGDAVACVEAVASLVPSKIEELMHAAHAGKRREALAWASEVVSVRDGAGPPRASGL